MELVLDVSPEATAKQQATENRIPLNTESLLQDIANLCLFFHILMPQFNTRFLNDRSLERTASCGLRLFLF